MSTWCTARRPRYSLTRTKVGLVTGAVTPRPRTRPCTKHVLPAPSAPVKPTTSPAPSRAPSRSPAEAVASGESATTLTVMREPAERLAERVDHVARHQRLLADAFGSDVTGEAVQVDGGAEDVLGGQAAREQRADDSGEDVAGAAARHPRIASRIDEHAAVWRHHET